MLRIEPELPTLKTFSKLAMLPTLSRLRTREGPRLLKRPKKPPIVVRGGVRLGSDPAIVAFIRARPPA